MPQYNGVWTLEAAAQAQSNQQWVTDPNFKNTTLLLQADGVGNGSQNNTFLDSSSNSFPVTRFGNTTQGSFTPFSQSAGRWSNYFGGSTDYIAFTSIAAYGLGTSNYTIECNVSFNSTAGNQRIFCIGASGTDGLVLQYTGGTGVQLFSAASGSATVFTYAFTPVVGTWYNFTVVRSGTGTNQVVLYLNGISVATGTSAVSVGQNAALIGGISWNSTYTVNGYINNFRLSNTARYSADFNPATSPFSSDANTILLTCQNNRFVDTSSTGNTFTIGGTPLVQPFSPFAPQFQWTAPVIGGSGYFAASTDYLTTPCATNNSAFGTADFTVEVWIYPTASATYVTPLSSNYSSGTAAGNWAFYFGVGSATTVYFNGGTANSGSNHASSTTTTIPLNAWTQVVYSRVSSVSRFFINGVQLGTTVSDTNNYSSVTGTLYFGRMADGTNTLTGYVSDVRIIKGTGYTTYSLPTAPLTAITNTGVLLSFTNAGIYDGKMANNLQTVGNAQVSTSVVKYGSGSIAFDGTGDQLVFPNSQNFEFGSGNHTVECWVYITGTSGSIINYSNGQSSNSNFSWEIYQSSSSVIQYTILEGGAAYQASSSAFSINAWNHIAAVRIDGVLRIYVNGVVGGTTAAVTGVSISVRSGATLKVSGYNNLTGMITGYIDDFRITKGVARYYQNFIPPQVALPRQ